MTKHIYKAKRGEGKTKWLASKALDSMSNGREVYYLGSAKGFMPFMEACKAVGVNKVSPYTNTCRTPNFDVFTDELIDELQMIRRDALPNIARDASNWYITMSEEDFEVE